MYIEYKKFSCKTTVCAEVGKQTFFYSPQIANPKILGLIPVSEVLKFLTCAGPQIANPQIFWINSKIAIPQISTKCYTTLSQNSLKSSLFLKDFFVMSVYKFIPHL